jgi:hypothetical protein
MIPVPPQDSQSRMMNMSLTLPLPPHLLHCWVFNGLPHTSHLVRLLFDKGFSQRLLMVTPPPASWAAICEKRWFALVQNNLGIICSWAPFLPLQGTPLKRQPPNYYWKDSSPPISPDGTRTECLFSGILPVPITAYYTPPCPKTQQRKREMPCPREGCSTACETPSGSSVIFRTTLVTSALAASLSTASLPYRIGNSPSTETTTCLLPTSVYNQSANGKGNEVGGL